MIENLVPSNKSTSFLVIHGEVLDFLSLLARELINDRICLQLYRPWILQPFLRKGHLLRQLCHAKLCWHLQMRTRYIACRVHYLRLGWLVSLLNHSCLSRSLLSLSVCSSACSINVYLTSGEVLLTHKVGFVRQCCGKCP